VRCLTAGAVEANRGLAKKGAGGFGMGLGRISGVLSKIADKAADVAAGAIAEAVVAANGGVPRRLLDRCEPEAPKPAAKVPEPPLVVGNLTRILADFAAGTPDVDIRRLLPPSPRARLA